MTRLLSAAAKLAALAAILFVGSSCTSRSSFAIADTGGGPWPGWKDIDEGGFEELGWVLWPETAVRDAKTVAWGPVGVVPEVDYEFYRRREGLARLCPFKSYVRLAIGDHDANRIVLDQAAVSGGMVHVSGRQRSGLHPGAAYVEVTRVTPAKPAKRIAW